MMSELSISSCQINLFTTSFKLLFGNNVIGLCDISIRKLSDYEKKYIKEEKEDKYTFNIDWIEIYREEKEKYNIPTVSLPKNLGTFFLNYCLKEMMNKHNEMDIKFSTLDNCIDNKGDIYFYKKLGYEWIYFDEKENKPSGPEMIKFL